MVYRSRRPGGNAVPARGLRARRGGWQALGYQLSDSAHGARLFRRGAARRWWALRLV